MPRLSKQTTSSTTPTTTAVNCQQTQSKPFFYPQSWQRKWVYSRDYEAPLRPCSRWNDPHLCARWAVYCLHNWLTIDQPPQKTLLIGAYYRWTYLASGSSSQWTPKWPQLWFQGSLLSYFSYLNELVQLPTFQVTSCFALHPVWAASPRRPHYRRRHWHQWHVPSMIGTLHPALALQNYLELIGQMKFVGSPWQCWYWKVGPQLVVLQPLFVELLSSMVGLLTIIYMGLNDLFI